MVSVKSKSKEVREISWSDSVWFFDIDDTLINTEEASLDGSEGVRKVIEAHLGEEKAKEIQENFNKIFQLMVSGYRVINNDWSKVEGGKEAFDALLAKVENCQSQVKQKYSAVKKWSREMFIKFAADQAGANLTPEIINEAADSYWLTLTEKTIVYPRALELIKEIKNHNRPIFLFTSSDARLKMTDGGQFEYDPEYSMALKRERIELLREKGVNFNIVSIGDPEDKPHLDFFQKGLQMAEADLGKPVALSNAIMFGDSFGGDLQNPKEKMGFGMVVLHQKGKQTTDVNDAHQITTGNLHDVIQYLN